MSEFDPPHEPIRGPIAASARLGAAVAALALLSLMAITVADVVARNAGLGAINGLIEFSNLTVLALGYLGLGYCFLMNGHIAVDIATFAASERTKNGLDRLWSGVAALFLAIVAVVVAQNGWEMHASGETSPSLHWSPLAFQGPAVIGIAAAVEVCLALARGGRPPPGA